MKITLNALFAAGFAIALVGCCKDNEDEIIVEPSPVVYANYTPLAVGNYWIYERYQVHVDGTETPLGVVDSSYVEKDTIIHDNTFYKLIRGAQASGNPINVLYMRDSLQYLVSPNGDIIFSSEDFNTVFRTNVVIASWDTMFVSTATMQDKDSLVVTPAGTFSTSSFTVAYDMYVPFDDYGDR